MHAPSHIHHQLLRLATIVLLSLVMMLAQREINSSGRFVYRV